MVELSRDVAVDLTNIRERFFEMEEAEGLFNLRMDDGTHYWDLVRLNVFYYLHTTFGGPYAIQWSTPAERSAASRVKDFARRRLNRVALGYLESRRPKYLFITGQRIRVGDAIVDNISDHLLPLVGEDAVAIETMNRRAVSMVRFLMRRPTRISPPAILAHPPLVDLTAVGNAISAVVERYFGHRIERLPDLLRDPISIFRQSRDHYRALFARHRPRAIVLINDGTLKGLFHAAAEHGVATLELQHGASCANNVFWSYPEFVRPGAEGLSVPTAYLTFSEYWRHNMHYPVKASFAIGNDFFYQEPSAGDDRYVVIISAYMYHDDLLALAVELAGLAPERTIYYKLHPHQFTSKAAIIEAVRTHPNIVVISDEIDVPSLFRTCGFVVGVHSTLLYSALQAGKKVCIYRRYNYFWHDDIFAYTERFDNAHELAQLVEAPHRYFANLASRPSMFDRFDAHRFRNALAESERITL